MPPARATQVSRIGLAAAMAGGLAACGGSPGAVVQPSVVFFGIGVKQFHPPPRAVPSLEALLLSLVDELPSYRAVPKARVLEQLRGKRGRHRRCLQAPCQVRVGRELAAAAALAVRIEKNLLQQCDVYASLYQLRRSGADQRARARAGCELAALRDSVERAACRVLSASPDGSRQQEDARFSECLQAAEVLWLDQELEQFGATKLSGLPEEIVASERRQAERALTLRSRYRALIQRTASPRWSVIAECHSAGIYQAFAASLGAAAQNLEVPRTVQAAGEEAVKAFRSQMQRSLSGRTQALRRQAADIYRGCLKRAEALNVSTRHTDQARKELAALEKK